MNNRQISVSGMSKRRFAFLYQMFPGGSDGKTSAYNAGDPGSIPGSGKIPWRRIWQSTPVLLPGKSHGQRSVVGYSPWGLKESDTTEQLHIHTYIPDVKTMRKKAKGFSTQTFNILQE